MNQTNILFESTSSVAIFDDSAHDTNASRRFKVWGNIAAQDISHEASPRAPAPRKRPPNMPWKAPQMGGLAVSANGLDWTDYKMLQKVTDPARDAWRFDAQVSTPTRI